MPTYPHDLDPDFDEHGLTMDGFSFPVRGQMIVCRRLPMEERAHWRSWTEDDTKFFEKTLEPESFDRFMEMANHPIAPLEPKVINKAAALIVNHAILGLVTDDEDVTEPPKRRGSSRGRTTAARKPTGD